ncbi:MAG TPA: hypothetical protein PL037_06985, partial [Elusimicrobiales bacterium]|nr:hypothetical protein [Elusimicrobiales bacterium]
AVAALLWPALSGGGFAYWDEFSHWGLAAKEIFARGALPPLESALRFKDYPPGTALFQYYAAGFTGWSEGAASFAQTLLPLAAAAALMQGTTWERAWKPAAILSLSYLLAVFFNYRPQSLYVDHVLGFLFGTAIASSLLSEDGTRRTLVRLIPTLAVLPLIKAAGLVLALIAAAAAAAGHLIALRVRDGSLKRLGPVFLCAALLLAPLAAARSWNAHVARIGAAKTFDTGITAAGLLAKFSGPSAETGVKTALNFAEALFGKQVGRTLPPVVLVIILTLAALAALKLERRAAENLRIRAVYLWLLAGFFVYSGGLLLLYLFSFSSYEGMKLASFGRYMGTFFLGWSLATAAFFLRLPAAAAPSRGALLTAAALVLGAAVTLAANALKKTPPEKTLLHRDIKAKAAYASARTPADSRIYVIWQGSDGFEPQVMAYELSPRITSTRGGGWSLGKPYGPDDVWTADLPPKEWGTVLRDYDFVLIGKADGRFWKEYGGVFGPGPRSEGLFKIPRGGKDLKLLPV